MTTDSQLALVSLGLLTALAICLRSALRLTAAADRRMPPSPARSAHAGVGRGQELPKSLLSRTLSRQLRQWPKMVAILVLREGCRPCDDLEPELQAAIRSYRDFAFFVDGWGAQRRPMENLTVLHPGTAALELGISISPAIVIAVNGVINNIALVNVGGQLEAVLQSAYRTGGLQ